MARVGRGGDMNLFQTLFGYGAAVATTNRQFVIMAYPTPVIFSVTAPGSRQEAILNVIVEES